MKTEIAILCTGDEIVNGDILNTNAYKLAHLLHQQGLSPGLHLCCNDDEQILIESMQYLLSKHRVLIITGGLGPTSDDRTRFALAKVCAKKLVYSEASWQEIEKRLSSMGLKLSSSNKQQCYFPQGAKLLANPNGTAMGCCVEFDDKLIYMLPGPPRECLPMFEKYVLETLSQRFAKSEPMLRWRIFGLPEGQISEQLDSALKDIDCHTGYRWEYPYIEFKVMSKPSNHTQIRTIVEAIIGNHIISGADKTASEELKEFLEQNQTQLLIKDYATGGELEFTLAMPELSNSLHFHEPCQHEVKVIIKGLDEYWQQNKQGSTQIELSFEHENKVIQESHTLPFRNQFVRKYAVELIASRILEFASVNNKAS
jgi:nicotinamide-nucleotide amidase